ncbi:hypothetical protein Q3G72_015610 [Acer saccharum]|nr:hypothetical protein Q3G72_015610 [Acer saccharum]
MSLVEAHGKTQVTVEYRNEDGAMVLVRVHTIFISTQHDQTVIDEQIAQDLNEQKDNYQHLSVNEGHSDKMCDQVSDAILDACLEQDLESKVACETTRCTKTDMFRVFSEITIKAKVNYEKIVHDTYREIGFVGLDDDSCKAHGKTQVTIEYRNEGGAMVPVRVHTILISTQYDQTITDEQIAQDPKEQVIKHVIPA